VSRDEQAAADVLQQQMEEWGLHPQRVGNNVWANDPFLHPDKPTILLNAHIDTVKPVATWTRDPFHPTLEGDRLYGLGANDCGGGLVSLLQVFRLLCNEKNRDFNVIYAASCEEEVSGSGGMTLLLSSNVLPPFQVAIVGEPTGMQPAIAEKGLMVIDGYAHGVSGHAARNEGVNAIYEALDDLVWLRDYEFRKTSPLLGPTKMTVTVVEAGTQHNVVPDTLHFVIDVRTNEYYQNEFVFEFLRKHMKKCELQARSFRLHSSSIAEDHPMIACLKAMGKKPFGSPTLSDQALMPFPSFKLGPGQSSRSHSADEYICISEIAYAIETYVRVLSA
jgi:acetylornithine deacetylase